MYNVLGEPVFEETTGAIQEKSITIQEGLSAGLYTLHIQSGDVRTVMHLIKE